MTYEEALEKATTYVDRLATNGRGYQDGVRFADKIAAVERFARFLIEEGRTDGTSTDTNLTESEEGSW
ncbi:hypothetical protein ACFCZT_24635 [Streptomyces sp. NPDC056230]|uniref:hypothetical protein n=1 Tax=Streptomyces sp. NPDC056230 TaxID=3345754 RepID=UPI0035DA1D9A